jgi:hypothetical protein
VQIEMSNYLLVNLDQAAPQEVTPTITLVTAASPALAPPEKIGF